MSATNRAALNAGLAAAVQAARSAPGDLGFVQGIVYEVDATLAVAYTLIDGMADPAPLRCLDAFPAVGDRVGILTYGTQGAVILGVMLPPV